MRARRTRWASHEMTGPRLAFVIICALAIGLAAGYLLHHTTAPSLEDRARGMAEQLKRSIERWTR